MSSDEKKNVVLATSSGSSSFSSSSSSISPTSSSSVTSSSSSSSPSGGICVQIVDDETDYKSEAKKIMAALAEIVGSLPRNEEGNAEIIAWVYDKGTPKGDWIYSLLGSYTMTRAMDVCASLVQRFGTDYVTFSVVPKGKFHQINDDAATFEVLQDSSATKQVAKTRTKVINNEKKTKAEIKQHMDAEMDKKSVEYFSNVVYRCTFLYTRIQQYTDENKSMITQYRKRVEELQSLLKQYPTHMNNWEADAKTFNKKCEDPQAFSNMKRWFNGIFGDNE